jgi:hypothetical protein
MGVQGGTVHAAAPKGRAPSHSPWSRRSSDCSGSEKCCRAPWRTLDHCVAVRHHWLPPQSPDAPRWWIEGRVLEQGCPCVAGSIGPVEESIRAGTKGISSMQLSHAFPARSAASTATRPTATFLASARPPSPRGRASHAGRRRGHDAGSGVRAFRIPRLRANRQRIPLSIGALTTDAAGSGTRRAVHDHGGRGASAWQVDCSRPVRAANRLTSADTWLGLTSCADGSAISRRRPRTRCRPHR